MEEKHICQSCGTVIDSPDLFGTHGDGHRNEDYCIHCYKNGVFTCNQDGIEHHQNLKRWMKDVDKSSWILDRCGYVTLSTIDEEGFPRPVAIVWMTTFRYSEKAKHLNANPKAGISFVREADCVSLTGTAKIITGKDMLRRYWKDFFIRYYPYGVDDENYCLIMFSARKAKLWIDGQSSLISF